MSIEEQHIAMPKLYGAPAYARPPMPVETVPRPFDPDELPIEADQTEEEREFAAALPPQAFAPGGIDLGLIGRSSESSTSTGLRPRSFSLRGLADKVIRG